MLRLLDTILEAAPRFLCRNNSRMYANGNKVQRAQAADPTPASIECVNSMAEPIKSPENTSAEVVELVINDIIESMMPRHALQRVKRYVARECIKPPDWSVRHYYQRLSYMNAVELPLLQPFGGPGHSFSEAELKEILLVATPPEWQREMDRMGFDPTISTNAQILNFMENLEAVERAERSIMRAPPRGMLARFSAFAIEDILSV